MKKVTVITGTRAEFGILSPLLKKLRDNKDFELQLIACAMHLSPEFGNTIDDITKSGFHVDKKIECILSSDSSVGVSKSVGLAVISFSEALEELKPNLVILLGDRTEILAAAIASTIANIPIAHIHGGETTEGAYDESIRHAITKMSYLHFTSTEIYKKRVIQLGESPNRVFNVGAMGLDSVNELKLMNKVEFEESIDFKLGAINFLITYHPVTLESETAKDQFKTILNILNRIEGGKFIFTYANSDKDGRIINEMIEEFVSQHSEKAIAFKSLGHLRYLSALKYVNCVLGNSSSGILEVPFFNIPTINIGDRQKGRIAAESVIHAKNDEKSILQSIQLALSEDFTVKIKNQKQIYGDGNSSSKIIDILSRVEIKDLKKKFHDINF